MNKKNSDNKELFNLYFGGKYNEIDSKTLATSLTSISTIFEEINKELKSNKRIELRVKPFQPGSFIVPIEAIELFIASYALFPQNISYIKEIIKILIELLNLKKFLKGEPPKEVIDAGDQKKISTKYGDTIYVDNRTYNLYKDNTIVNCALQDKFQRLEEDETIDNFQLMDKSKKTLIEIRRNEFRHFSSIAEKEIPPTKTTIEKVGLYIFRIVFDGYSQWAFYYNDVRITAKIMDEDFIKRMLQGEKFANGDMLQVELEIDQEFDAIANTYVNKAYRIRKVLDHIPKSQHQELGI